jgi:hypothetical protein
VSLPGEKKENRRGTDRLSDSLAARLASRKSALAPWLCVTVFRRVCSEQRFYILTMHGTLRVHASLLYHETLKCRASSPFFFHSKSRSDQRGNLTSGGQWIRPPKDRLI